MPRPDELDQYAAGMGCRGPSMRLFADVFVQRQHEKGIHHDPGTLRKRREGRQERVRNGGCGVVVVVVVVVSQLL